MLSKIRFLCLSLAAIAALTSLASSSSVSAAEFHSETEQTILTGTNESFLYMKSTGAEVVCQHLSVKGTAVKSSETNLTLFPRLTKCTFFGENAEIDTTGCAYTITSHTGATGHLPISIECTPGRAITITAPSCALTIGAQTASQGLQATNVGSGSSREVTVHLTGQTTFSKSGPLCFLISGSIGVFSGTVKVAGFEDNGIHGAIDEYATVYTEGKQVGVWWG